MAGNFDFLAVEEEVLKYWAEQNTYNALKEKLAGKEKFYFLDGPPYTSGKVHIGTAWNKSLKDMVLRYKRMRGFDVWDRAGYDMHGLPVEHKVEAKFGIKHKEEIPQFGVERFVQECRKLALDNLAIMNLDFVRMGVWMDFENCYKSIENTFIEGVWWMVKKAHENQRLYEGEMSLSWCGHCATALSKHELEYKNVTDTSIFLKFKIVGTKNEYLIIWTTTPWTIPYNLAVMVNPTLDYVKAEVDGEVWIVAASLANAFIGEVAHKQYKIQEQFKGEKLKGLKYEHPFEQFLKPIYDTLRKKSDKVHSVVLSEEFVDATAGSGLVHMAPGCGPEDFEVGHREGIPPLNNLNEEGKFPEEMGRFSGLFAKQDDKRFIEELETIGALIASTKVDHEYAHCWRCKHPIIFKTTKQWFFKVEDLKENMKALNKDILWVPDWAGSRQFDAWLDNLRDNGITRQRYWGTPVPIWTCTGCKKTEIIGSAHELQSKGVTLPSDLHKPWIDEVSWSCTCGGTMKRLPDVLDVWIDAGSTSWNCLNYPHEKQHFNKMFPADFILEGKDQIRGWFNLLLVASMVTMQKPSFKAVYMHGFVQDALGRKMSKSLGNYILPEEVIQKYGADTLRYYMISGANPAIDINYNFEDMKIKHKNLGILWNLHKFLLDYAAVVLKNPREITRDNLKLGTEELYILSKMHSCIKKVTDRFENYALNEVPLLVEELMLELSRGYLQMVREKSATGEDEEKTAVLYATSEVFMSVLSMFSVVAPFITEKIYQNLRETFGYPEESIHHFSWPVFDEAQIDEELETQMQVGQQVIQQVLSLREKSQEGVRWPLSEVVVVSEDLAVTDAVTCLSGIIKKQVNVKNIVVQKSFDKVQIGVKLNFTAIRASFGTKTPQIIASFAAEKSLLAVYKHLMAEGSYTTRISGEQILFLPEHFTVEKKIPETYKAAPFKGGELYLNLQKTKELEAEGYAREIMRRVQNLRKLAGLQKQDSIALYIMADGVVGEACNAFSDAISEKVGATQLVVGSGNPKQEFPHTSTEKIKDFSVSIWLRKL